MTAHRSALGVASLAAFSVLAMSACSSNVTESGSASSSSALVGPPAAAAPKDKPAPKPKPTPSSTEVDVPAGVVGAGCAAYVQEVPTGAGSVLGMARDPVAVALSNSAELTTLAGALSGKLNADVDLTEFLNKGRYTVFAPTDAAFGKLPPETLDKFRNDSGLLTAVLQYHVVIGELDPPAVVGEQKTVQGQSVKVSSSGDELRVNDAGVVCGGIKAANATVYLVDTVLMPPPPPAPATPTTTTSGEQSSDPTGTTPTS